VRIVVAEARDREYSSPHDVMNPEALDQLPVDHRLTLDDTAGDVTELLL
jgi:hypothetical protein